MKVFGLKGRIMLFIKDVKQKKKLDVENEKRI
jgi:hypothetical protein